MQQRLKGVDSINDLPEIKYKTYIKNIYGCRSIVAHWVALHVNSNNVTNFDIFEVEYIPFEIKKLTENKLIITNKEYRSIMCGYLCIVY